MITFFNPKYLEFLLLQRTRLKTEYSITESSDIKDILNALNLMTEKDFELCLPFLDDTLPKDSKILDIGCGLGMFDVFLSKKYEKSTVFLQDKSDTIDMINRKYNGFNQKYYYYNNLDLLTEFISSNSVKNYKIINGEELFNINEKFDLIMSLLSCGWHYSLTTYLDYIKNHLTDTGKLIIDVRNDTEESLLYTTFHNVNRIFNENEKRHDGGIVGYRYICSKLK
jgi:SAM-dependent methyltransferase